MGLLDRVLERLLLLEGVAPEEVVEGGSVADCCQDLLLHHCGEALGDGARLDLGDIAIVVQILLLLLWYIEWVKVQTLSHLLQGTESKLANSSSQTMQPRTRRTLPPRTLPPPSGPPGGLLYPSPGNDYKAFRLLFILETLVLSAWFF